MLDAAKFPPIIAHYSATELFITCTRLVSTTTVNNLRMRVLIPWEFFGRVPFQRRPPSFLSRAVGGSVTFEPQPLPEGLRTPSERCKLVISSQICP